MNTRRRVSSGKSTTSEVMNRAVAGAVSCVSTSETVRRHGRVEEIAADSPDAFDTALTGAPVLLIAEDGRQLPTAAARWYASAGHDDDWLLGRCTGPTLDLGCGPGRLVTELTARGVRALGVDCSRQAVRECHARGAPMLHRDLFAVLPEEGRWRHVLLADGNIGIGGDPRTLLRRCAQLVRPGGTVLVETAPADQGGSELLWRGNARLHNPVSGLPAGPWFPWAVITTDALTAIAGQLHLRTVGTHHGARDFVELQRTRP